MLIFGVLRHVCLRPASLTKSGLIFKAYFSTDGPGSEMRVSMIQGASRGIGLEFVKQLLGKDEKAHVVATCRNPDQSAGLSDLKNRFAERLNVLKLDVTDESTIQEAAESVREKYGYLNLLVNTSGILSVPDVMQPETTLSKVQKSALMFAYEVNAVGPILVIKHMWPLLKTGGGVASERPVAVAASLSARVGSISDNRLGGWHSYRASKAALNQLTKTTSVEFGRKKDSRLPLTAPGHSEHRSFNAVPDGKLFTTEFSVENLLSIINHATICENELQKMCTPRLHSTQKILACNSISSYLMGNKRALPV